MLPAFSHNDLSDSIMGETKISPNAGLGLSCGMASTNVQDLLFGQGFGVSSVFDGMSRISSGSCPLKVIRPIILSDEINVINNGKIVWVGNKGERDKAVYTVVLLRQGDAPISIFIEIRAENFSFSLPDCFLSLSDKSIEASHAADTPMVGYFVDPFMAGDIAPFFYHCRTIYRAVGHVNNKESDQCL